MKKSFLNNFLNKINSSIKNNFFNKNEEIKKLESKNEHNEIINKEIKSYDNSNNSNNNNNSSNSNDYNNNINSINKNGKTSKLFKNRTIENLTFFIIILVVTLVLVKYIFSGDKSEKQSSNYNNAELVYSNDVLQEQETASYKDDLKSELINILKKINGVGEVDVLITYSETSKLVPVYNENSSESKTSEEDTEGGTRVIESYDSSKEVVTDESSEPITERIIMPKIEGAIVICEGANDINVKNNVISAVEAATGLKVHKIQVFEMKNNK